MNELNFGKLLLKATIFVITLCISVYLLLYVLIKNTWRFHMNENNLIEFCNKVNSSETLPDDIIKIYNKIHTREANNSLFKVYNVIFFNQVFGLRLNKYMSRRFYCEEIYEFYPKSPIGWHNIFDRKLVFSAAVERLTTNKKCLNYWMLNKTFRLNDSLTSKGVKQLSIDYFHKPLDKLNKDEKIKLIAIIDLSWHNIINERRVNLKHRVYKRYLNHKKFRTKK